METRMTLGEFLQRIKLYPYGTASIFVESTSEPLEVDTVCYIFSPPIDDVNIERNLRMKGFIEAIDLELTRDVVEFHLAHSSDSSPETLLKALKYFTNHDTYWLDE